MRHLGSYSIVSFLILILIGQTYGVLGQTYTIANHVVINEADINPPGDDTKYPIDWVELYNPTNSPVKIGGWTIGATTGLRQTSTIPANTIIQSKQFLVYTNGPLWFPHAGAVIQLKSSDGVVVDQTPPLTDFQGDANSWQRLYDGYNTNSSSDWVFKLATPGSSNGQPPTTMTVSPTTITFAIDKTSYIFADTVIMSGKVSKLVSDPVLGYPFSVNLLISGPSGFQKIFTLYPNNNLQFSTSMKTDQVLGFREGNYTISASYGSASALATFSLSAKAFTPPPQAAPITMTISTDKSTYTTSDTITLSGAVSQVIPFTPVAYKVYDPNGTMIYQGNLFPDTQGKFSTYNPYQSHASASGIIINAITPTYGVYNIVATYGKVTTIASFALVSPAQQSADIVVSTDKQVYGLGETVTISGRTKLAGLQNSALSPGLEIIHAYFTNEGRAVPQSMDIKTFVKVQADNSFKYTLPLPNDSTRLGNYRVIVSLPQSTAETDFVVAQNPTTNQSMQMGPFSINTDKPSYGYGDPIIISGKVRADLIVGKGVQVQILLFNSSGGKIYSTTSLQGSGAVISKLTPLAFYALPDGNGNFLVKQTITPNIFTVGNYTLKGFYGYNLTASTSFSVYNSLATGNLGPIVANVDKQVYGVGETVHLTGKISILTGTSSYSLTLIKPTGDQISYPLILKNGLFSWDWAIPNSAPAGYSPIIGTYRGSVVNVNTSQNLYGIYTIDIHSGIANSKLFFQVSQNPQNQSQIAPITVQTDKTDYSTTEVVNISGQVLPQANAAAQEQNTQAQILIYSSSGQQVYRGFPNVNTGGQFHLSVPLHPEIWQTGTYKIYAQYLTDNTQSTFKVTDLFATSHPSRLQVLITTDRDKYLPGQTVLVTGRTSYIIAITNTYLTFGVANDTIISEGQVISQHGYTLQRTTVPFDQYGSFSYDYTIPKTTTLGNYTVIAQVPFGTFNAYYQVVNQLPPENILQGNVTSQGNVTQVTHPPANVTQALTEPSIVPTSIGPTQKRTAPSSITYKEGMLAGSSIPIIISQKTVGNGIYYPREIDGSLRVNPNDMNTVTIKLSSPDGVCVIGPHPNCKISQSTSQSGSLYQIVKLGNENFLAGFSGQGQRIQQFSLIPANANDVIPYGQWNVDVIKKDQVSRFYYQVTYISK